MNRKGFTLIELLIVVVIIGILAAIAIPKFANTKEKAYIASMRTDLRNLVSVEEAYFSDNTTYSSDQAALNYTPSAGVTVAITVAAGPPVNWTATATHVSSGQTCGIAMAGATNPVTASANEGEPACQ